MPDILEELNEDPVLTTYSLLVNIDTVVHVIVAGALLFMVR
jgi:hypothetical protein